MLLSCVPLVCSALLRRLSALPSFVKVFVGCVFLFNVQIASAFTIVCDAARPVFGQGVPGPSNLSALAAQADCNARSGDNCGGFQNPVIQANPNYIPCAGEAGPSTQSGTGYYRGLEISGTYPDLTFTFYISWYVPYEHCPDGMAPNPDNGNLCELVNMPDFVKESGLPQHCEEQPASGYPIYFGSGNKYLEATDYEGSGPMPLVFKRFYNSNAGGRKWRFSYQRRMYLPDSNTKVIVRDDGKAITFYRPAQGNNWISEADTNTQLATDSSGNQLVTYSDGRFESYDSYGRLHIMANGKGQFIQLSYLGGSYNATTVTDYTGRSLSLAYDIYGRVTSMTDPDGNVFTYQYNTGLEFVTFPGDGINPSSQIQYLYEDPLGTSRVTGIIDENGDRYSTYSYNGQGLAASSELAGGVEKTQVTYDALAGTANVTNALGKQAVYTFAEHHDVRKMTSVDGQPTSLCAATTSALQYDTNGYISQKTDKNGLITSFVRNTEGRITSKTEAVGTTDERLLETVWHAVHPHLPQIIKQPGHWTRFNYDGAGRVLTREEIDRQSLTEPYNGYLQKQLWTFTYTDASTCEQPGLIKSVDGPRSDVNDLTTYEYYCGDTADHRDGDLKSVTNALGQVTEYVSYDANGRLTRMRDPNGIETVYEYAPRGWLRKQTIEHPTDPALNSTTEFEYDAAGQITRIYYPNHTVASPRFMKFEYDAAHRLTAMEDSAGNRIEYTLDDASNVTIEHYKDSAGGITRQIDRLFDELSRLREVSSPTAVVQKDTFDYDNMDNQDAWRDGSNHATNRLYDQLSRLKQETNRENNAASYTYDGRDNLLSVTDFKGNTTTYTYDGFDRLIQIISPDTGKTVMYYDKAGNLTERRYNYNGANFESDTFTYDALNRMTTATYPDGNPGNTGTYTYVYDQVQVGADVSYGIGRLAEVYQGDAANKQHHYRYVHDYLGRVTKQARKPLSSLPDFIEHAYGYDLAGNIVSMTYESGRLITYERDDPLSRVTKITSTPSGGSPTDIVSGVQYKPFGPHTSWTYGNGATTSRTYDIDYRLTSQLNIASSPVWNYSYTARGNIASIVDPLGDTKTFTYDLEERLDTASVPLAGVAATYNYNHDTNGNRTQLTLDEGTGQTTLTYTNDPASNRLNSVSDGTTTRALSYDSAGRLISDPNLTLSSTYGQKVNGFDLIDPISQIGVSSTYQYNHEGVRDHALWTDSQGPSSQTTDAWSHAYGLGGELLGDYSDALVAEREWVYLNGEPAVMFTAGGGTYYYQNDHLATPQIVTDAAQNVVWRADYKPFGEVSERATGYSLYQPLRFPGQYKDLLLDVHYNYFRNYDPAIGRYTTSDPIGLDGGLNTYAYVGGNPLSYVDPRGLHSTGIHEGITYPHFDTNPQGRSFTGEDRALPDNHGQASCQVTCFLPDLGDVAGEGIIQGAGKVGGEVARYVVGRVIFVQGVYDTAVCIRECDDEVNFCPAP